ncbi:hypothetical protein [Pseudoalteromonas tunicata]|jgi:hypothetical protein|uniref:Uncharacterized protein n=1 Tax=Pseudoalteromonas tunicata D2 TaxID=87626 RepID=A4C5F2_9GAMM|nr:hypothetical protein [Pseudoalteromonas tunicata]ATC96738.1 hypothetical protein PTUN_b0331 [Pseudoalteromonas tunicata]AXT32898.1 hypothetical protein D1819_18810 [Pseudoalteromonas tunicata]EAR30784.1 hypothetical protein PTD2_04406 [Pseudoalteromonas tunicata D2]
MKEFELESLAEKIHFGKTKSYFSEVINSYQNKCYRSSVVMLWSVSICDLVYKLQVLVDQYDDKVAKNILDNVKSSQQADPKSASWELQILDDVFNKTNLIDSSEYENLRYLQKQRHLSAHPVLKENLELYTPNKETVRSLIRNTLEGVLIKPPFYTQKVTQEFLEDLDEAKDALNSFKKLKKYIESRYLDRLSPDLEMALFKTLWKLTFKLDDEKCAENRFVNLKAMRVIADRNKGLLTDTVASEPDYFNNISPSGTPIEALTFFLSLYPEVYPVLAEDSKLKIQHAVETTDVGKICGWFINGDLENHFENIVKWIEGDDHPKFSDNQWEYLLDLSDSDEWEQCYCKMVASYYCASRSFDTADLRFSQVILPNLKLFNVASAIYLLEKIEPNNQVWARGRAYRDHPKVRSHFDKVLGTDFDYSPYRRFDESSKEEVDE